MTSVASNVKWVALAQGARVLIHLAALVVLARLIPPSEHGLMAMATVATNFAMLIRDLGTSAAVIQRETVTAALKQAVFQLNMLVGLAIAVVLIVGAPWIAAAFVEPRLMGMLWVLAFSFPLASSAALHQALIERESGFRALARIEVVAALSGLTAAVAAALMGAGVYSLVAQTMVTVGASTLQLWWQSGWRPRRERAQGGEIRSLLGFSGNLTLFNIVNYFARNVDSMLIGRYMSSATLGAYSLAYRVMLFPLQSLSFVTSRALYPIMARQQSEPERMRALYLQSVGVVTALVAPLMMGLAVLREPFVALVFGPRWELAADLLLWLAPTGLIQAIVSTTGVVFMASGNTRLMMWLGLLGAVLLVGASAIGVQYDIHTFVALYFFANVLNALPALHLAMRQLGGALPQMLGEVAVPVLVAVAMGLLLHWLGKLFPPDASMGVFVATCIVGGAIYGAGLLALRPRFGAYLMQLVRTRGVRDGGRHS